ncbi:hypothetical protein M9458_010524, partial [Cirrhinus mrigala]
ITVRNVPLGQPPRKSNLALWSCRKTASVRTAVDPALSIAASEEGLSSSEADGTAEQPSSVVAAQSEQEAELTAMLETRRLVSGSRRDSQL